MPLLEDQVDKAVLKQNYDLNQKIRTSNRRSSLNYYFDRKGVYIVFQQQKKRPWCTETMACYFMCGLTIFETCVFFPKITHK